MTKTPRWIKSAITTSTQAAPALPWARGTRRKPESLNPAKPQQRAIAAR
jgi:hypothetical protein